MNKKMLRRILLAIPAIVLQIVWFVVLTKWLSPYATLISIVVEIFAFVFVMYLMVAITEGTYKILWLMVILAFPVTGAILYLFFGNKRSGKPLRRKIEASKKEMDVKDTYQEMATRNKRLDETLNMLQKETGYPALPLEKAKYYSLGEDMWKDMLIDLKKARKSIYLEYFIIQNGKMWDSMVEILEKKVLNGVDVRLMYDDIGSFATYGMDNVKELREKGIKCFPFNPLMTLKGTLNYRDHRKMLIIDEEIAYSGGVNLADEYINEYEKHGHWKDIGFRITGRPVDSYLRMFIEFYNAFTPEDKLKYVPKQGEETKTNRGTIISYYDSPVGKNALSYNFYIELINQAKDYVYFYTPYLMLGDDMMNSLIRAAKRGVDIRIIMPGIPDKKVVYRISRSYYRPLMEAGVRIFEYTPGFVHAKALIMDDIICTIGTVNLDYRSLFLHFENNSVFYKSRILNDLKTDYLLTQDKCVERTVDNMKHSFVKFLVDGVLRIFAPLC
ncbi:MAG: cardiolipin synthase [Erysipelotrichaceae bacterium]